jgi:hypothetical protein
MRSSVLGLLATMLATAACTSESDAPGTAATPPATVARSVAIRDGVLRDADTNLEWTSRDHEEALPWEAAEAWCRGRPADGGPEWRLPELPELEAIYDPRVDRPCGDRVCHLDPAIGLGGPYVWSVTSRGAGTRFYYDYSTGQAFSPTLHPRLVRRTLCVRGSGRVESPP